METQLTHFDQHGNAIMVDVSEKPISQRIARAYGKIKVNRQVYESICNKTVSKGDVLAVARVAGIMAAKKTSDLIPMCHPLAITKCTIEFQLLEEESAVSATSLVKVNGQTGVEMEALTAVNIALLTIYDMCKALDKSMEISEVYLLEKMGGKSGGYQRT